MNIYSSYNVSHISEHVTWIQLTQLPQYANKPEPTFSEGWLSRFKKRHSIKHYRRHGEAGSVAVDAEEEMKGLRTIAGEYDEEDIYVPAQPPTSQVGGWAGKYTIWTKLGFFGSSLQARVSRAVLDQESRRIRQGLQLYSVQTRQGLTHESLY
jgi:hypothetical protein